MPHYQHYPPERWPAEITGLPVRELPDGTRLVNFADVRELYGLSPSGVRERRRQKRLPPIVQTDGNRTFCEIGALADAYLDEFPGKLLPLPPKADTPPSRSDTDAPVTDIALPDGSGAETRQGVRQSEAFLDGVEAVRNLLAQLVALERESDGQVSKLTEALAAQTRIMEMQAQEMAEKDAEIRRLREEAQVRSEASEAKAEASETRHRSVWQWLTKRRG